MRLKMHIKSIAKKFPFSRIIWYKYKRIKFNIIHPIISRINNKNRDGYIIQMVNTLSPKDAIGNSVFELHKYLNKFEIKNCILYFDSNSKGPNLFPANIFKINSKDTLIYHMGCGSNMSEIFAKASAKKKILIYHNITPSKYFFDNVDTFKGIEKGRTELKALQKCTNLGVCISEFSEMELKKLGYKNTCVLSIPTRVPDLLKLKTNKTNKRVNFITVGRIARHKCVQDVIKTFSEIHKLNKNTKLNIVGGYDNLKYLNELKSLISENKLNDSIEFIHGAPEEKLAELYSNASGYICMSEHEGFCVPLVEAMAFNVPIFAYASTAIPETLGGAGVLFDQKNDFKLIAKTIMDTLNDKEKVKELIKKEQNRYKDFDNDKILNNYVKAILGE